MTEETSGFSHDWFLLCPIFRMKIIRKKGKGKKLDKEMMTPPGDPLWNQLHSVSVLQCELVAGSHRAMSYTVVLEGLLYARPKRNAAQVFSPLSPQQYHPQLLLVPFHRRRHWCLERMHECMILSCNADYNFPPSNFHFSGPLFSPHLDNSALPSHLHNFFLQSLWIRVEVLLV